MVEEKDKKKVIIELEFEHEPTQWTKDWIDRSLKAIPRSPWGDIHKVTVKIKE